MTDEPEQPLLAKSWIRPLAETVLAARAAVRRGAKKRMLID